MAALAELLAVALLAVLCVRPAAGCPPQCRCDPEEDWARCEDPDLERAPAGLPDSLKSLVLDLPRLRQLSADSLSELRASQLQKLSVTGGLRTVLSSAFARLPRLDSLHVFNSRLGRLDPDAFPPSLERLYITNSPLQLPSSGPLLRAPNVTDLKLDSCGLTELSPRLLTGLPKLELLWLGDNRLTELGPEVLTAVPRLTHLDLRGNSGPLRLHPDALAANRELRWLNLDFTRLQLPRGRLLSSASLKHLQLRSNRLRRLPPGLLRGLPELLYLHLGNNDIQALPQHIFRPVPKLMYLYLDGNRLTQLPAALLAPLYQLRYASLNNNSLGPVPATPLLQHPTLQGLSLADNGLTELLAAALAGVPQLQALDLSGSPQLQLDPDQLRASLPQLEELRLSDHPLVCPCVREELSSGWPPGDRSLTVRAGCSHAEAPLCRAGRP